MDRHHLDENTSATTAQDTWYRVRIVCDGTNVTVWRAELDNQRLPDEQMAEVLNTSGCTDTTPTSILTRK